METDDAELQLVDRINIFQDLKQPWLYNPKPNSLTQIRKFYSRRYGSVVLKESNGINWLYEVYARKRDNNQNDHTF